MRHDGRAPGDLREVRIEPGFVSTASGSALMSMGGTRVICTASVAETVPRWMQGKGRGWVTAEYGMLPASTGERKQRDVSKGRPDGRTVEIQRLIGRALRGVVDFERLGERTVWIDCDVLEADGGTRCAAVTGGYVALELALAGSVGEGLLEALPLTESVAAVSCGVVEGQAVVDLDYPEDSTAEVDMNVVMTGDGGLVEVQATGERTPLSRASLDELLGPGRRWHREPAPGPARRGGSPGRLRPPRRCAWCWQPETSTSCASSGRCWPRTSCCHCLPRSSCRPRTGARSPRTRWSRRAPRPRPRSRPRWPMTRGSRRRRSAERLASAPRGYAGEHATDEENLARLLREVPAGGDTRVAYVCVLAFAGPAAEELVAEGRCQGRLTHEPRGDGGFGYDPAFVPDEPGDGRTMAELTQEEKDAISHRGRAARALGRLLADREEAP